MATLTATETSWPVARAEVRVEALTGSAYMNPYLAGIGLGLTLLAAFVLMGRGLGASGAFKAATAWATQFLAPGWVASNAYLGGYVSGPTHPLKEWLVFEVAGVMVGALVSGALAGRLKLAIEKGPRVSSAARLVLAFAGGLLMALGANLARGCTSGQALSGGALLNLGSWAFMIMVFVGGYASAWFLRRQWR